MKRIAVTVCTVGLLISHLSAQRGGVPPGGGPPGGGGRPGNPGGGGGMGHPTRPAFNRGGFAGNHFANRQFQNIGLGFGGVFPWAYPAFYGDYGFPGDYAGNYQQQPNIFLVMPPPQAPPPEPPPPPPPPPEPVVREYHWPDSQNPPAPFSIVLNDGTVHDASMAWVQNGRLYFNVPEGGVRQVPLSAISRAQTQAANARKGLKLPL